MHHHGRVSGMRRPLVDPRRLSNQVHRPTGIKARGQRRARVKAIALVIKRARTAARINVRFEHGHIYSRAREHRRRRQAADARADDDHTTHGDVRSNTRRVRQPR